MAIPGRRIALLSLLTLSIAGNAAAEICVEVDVQVHGRDLSQPTLESMRREASSIWTPYGVSVRWLAASGLVRCTLVHGSFDVLVVHQPRRATTGPKAALGLTRLMPSGIDRAPIRLDYDATARVVLELTASQRAHLVGYPNATPADVGRALGRVLAHEIGHVLLGASCHQREGLMRKSFSPTDLVARRPWHQALSRREIERLRQREEALREYTLVRFGSTPDWGRASDARGEGQ